MSGAGHPGGLIPRRCRNAGASTEPKVRNGPIVERHCYARERESVGALHTAGGAGPLASMALSLGVNRLSHICQRLPTLPRRMARRGCALP